MNSYTKWKGERYLYTRIRNENRRFATAIVIFVIFEGLPESVEGVTGRRSGGRFRRLDGRQNALPIRRQSNRLRSSLAMGRTRPQQSLFQQWAHNGGGR